MPVGDRLYGCVCVLGGGKGKGRDVGEGKGCVLVGVRGVIRGM